MINFPASQILFPKFNSSIFRDPKPKSPGTMPPSPIWGYNGITRRQAVSAICCPSESTTGSPSGGIAMNAFYPTIWSHNKKNVLIENNAFGESPCKACT